MHLIVKLVGFKIEILLLADPGIADMLQMHGSKRKEFANKNQRTVSLNPVL